MLPKYCRCLKKIGEIGVDMASLQRWQVNHVSRNLNGAVYRLAKEALYVSEDQYFLEETPHIFRILSLLSNVLN